MSQLQPISNYPRKQGCPKCGKAAVENRLCRVCREGPLWKLPLLVFALGTGVSLASIVTGFIFLGAAVILIPLGLVLLCGTAISSTLLLAKAVRRKIEEP